MEVRLMGHFSEEPGETDPSDLVRRSAELIVTSAVHVTIHQEAIRTLAVELADQVVREELGLDRWKNHELHPKTADQHAVDWIFFVDTLNFSFWSEVEDASSAEKFAVDYKGKRWTGYWALCAAVNRALDEGVPILHPKWYSVVTKETLADVFRTSTKAEMPLLDERVSNLHEAGKVLLEKYDGTFVNGLRSAGKKSQELIRIVLTDFPSYRDECESGGRTLQFYKRAQILAADLWACFEGKGLGEFVDVDKVTIFPDYRVPQVLNYFGCMTYGDELEKKLRDNHMFKYGEKDEMEIRGCSVWVVELLRDELNRILKAQSPARESHINAIILDHYLWDYRQQHSKKLDKSSIPYHKVRCIYY